MKCKKHPKYKGILKPIADCLPCFLVYAEADYNRHFGKGKDAKTNHNKRPTRFGEISLG